jgi:Tfp pilus assembly protein PilX
MKIKTKNNGSVLLMVIFTIALLTAFVVGMLEMNTEQIQIMRNEIFAAQAIAIAEAGMADAFARIRTNSALPGNFSSSFGGGSYSVTITGSLPDPNINYQARVRADITVDTANSYVIRVDQLRINE